VRSDFPLPPFQWGRRNRAGLELPDTRSRPASRLPHTARHRTGVTMLPTWKSRVVRGLHRPCDFRGSNPGPSVSGRERVSGL